MSFDDLYLISEDDYEIVGNWKATKNKMDMTGKGIIIKKQSYYYEGDIKRGEANGQGHIFWDNYAKDTYDG